MIPNYQELMRPFLQVTYKAHNNGQVYEVKLRDVINQLAEQFNLTDEERTETLPSGKQSVLDNRVGWARTYLTKAGLLGVTRRAHFVITPRGIEALKDNVDISNDYLKCFDEFVAFKQKNNDSTETQSTTVLPAADAESDITPDEALRSAYRKINDALAEEIIERTRKVTPAFLKTCLSNFCWQWGTVALARAQHMR